MGCIKSRLPWYARVGEGESERALQHSYPAFYRLPLLTRAIRRVTHTGQQLVAIKVTPTIHHLGNQPLGAVRPVGCLTYGFSRQRWEMGLQVVKRGRPWWGLR